MKETATLCGMDSVRFGRALGVGARAGGEDGGGGGGCGDGSESFGEGEVTGAGTAWQGCFGGRLAGWADRLRASTAQVRQTGQGLKEGGKRFGEAVWGPFAKLSGVLWLELTGVFFGIFALFAGRGRVEDAGGIAWDGCES